MRWVWLPLILFVLFGATVAGKLIAPGNTEHPSKLVGSKMPSFALPPATQDNPGLASVDLIGRPRLLNVFASWCVPCASETGVLRALSQRGIVIDGVAIRDRPADLAKFLARNGNPYRAIGADVDAGAQIALGSSGVPETFVVDSRGIIRYQHIGEITVDDMPVILAELRAAV